MNEKACIHCKYICDKSCKECPICGSKEFTDKFLGVLYVLDYERSEIAQKLNIKANGKYAVRLWW